MTQMDDDIYIPSWYGYVYAKIRQRYKNMIRLHELEEWIKRIYVKNGGIPRSFINGDTYNFVEDMVILQLIRRVDRSQFEIVQSKNNNKFYRMTNKKINKFIW